MRVWSRILKARVILLMLFGNATFVSLAIGLTFPETGLLVSFYVMTAFWLMFIASENSLVCYVDMMLFCHLNTVLFCHVEMLLFRHLDMLVLYCTATWICHLDTLLFAMWKCYCNVLQHGYVRILPRDYAVMIWLKFTSSIYVLYYLSPTCVLSATWIVNMSDFRSVWNYLSLCCLISGNMLCSPPYEYNLLSVL